MRIHPSAYVLNSTTDSTLRWSMQSVLYAIRETAKAANSNPCAEPAEPYHI